MKLCNRYLSLVMCTLVIVAWVAAIGCNRSFYRRQADCDARMLIVEKLNDPRWSQIDPSIETLPESRMYDPFSADNPPMPHDDPASGELMQCVDGKPGYQYWNVNGNTTYVANPEWRAYLPLDENGVLRLDLDTAVQLSLIHSPLLQTQRENLYELALDVSLERFGFDLQAFNAWSGFFRTGGRNSRFRNSLPSSGPPGSPSGSSSFELGTPGSAGRTELTKLGISGTNFVVGLANSVLWSFGGDSTQRGSTLIDFTLIQPLLRGAARQVVMEGLTQAERNLLAGVRQLERFRRGFYLSIVTGENPGPGPITNFLNAPPTVNFNASGFLGLLQTRQTIRIQEFNVQSLENVLAQFREYFREQRVNLLQVRQAETSLYTAQRRLLELRVNYENQKDTFKRDLGLPPDLLMEINDPFLNQFELIDDELLERQLEVNVLRDRIGVLLSAINPESEDGSFSADQEIKWTPELNEAILSLLPAFAGLDPFFEKLEGTDRELVLQDFNKLESVTEQRKTELAELRAAISAGDAIYDIEPSILQPESVIPVGQLRNELAELETKIKLLRGATATIVEEIRQLAEDGPSMSSKDIKKKLTDQIVFDAPEVVTRLADAVIELTLLQARARTNSISLPPVELGSVAAWSIACQFRRDLMNARAALVDEWRQIELGADALESTFNVVLDGAVGTVGNEVNPFKLNWTTNQFGMGFRFDAPITRLAERNQYREILINYQQSRRAFYNFEDQIKQNLRQTLRVIDQSKVLFELNRRSIRVAVEQVELARFDLIKPVRPGQGGGQGNTLGPTAVRDLTTALNALQSAQDSFLQVWVSYEVARRSLDFDLGTMQLTPDGYYLDPGIINAAYAYRAAEAFGIPADTICLPPDLSLIVPEGGDSVIDGPLARPVEAEMEAVDGLQEPSLEPSLEPEVEDDQAGNGKAASGGGVRSAFRRAGLIR